MAQHETDRTEACALDTLTARYKILAENRARVGYIAKDLTVHVVRLVGLVAREVEHDLCGGLDVGDDALV